MPDTQSSIRLPGSPVAASVPAQDWQPPRTGVFTRRFNPLRRSDEQRSLFGEILDWMLAPLLLLWPMSVTLTFLVAQTISDPPYDRKLADVTSLLGDHVRVVDGRAQLQLGISIDELLRPSDSGTVAHMILGLRGELISGDRDLPLPAQPPERPYGITHVRFDTLRGSEVRIAYAWREVPGPTDQPPVLIQVAETLEKRSQLANEIIKGVIVPQFVVLPIAVILVWFALTRGLAPLAELQEKIRQRRPEDRSPIDPRGAPEEIAPLVESFNGLLDRLSASLQTQKRFIADAAHQMKTPLAGLRTQSELALRQTDTDELRRSLRQIASSTERATRLINQLLSLARAEHRGADAPGFEVLDLGQLAREVVRDWVPPALEREIDLGLDVAEEPLLISGSPLMLRELLNNLIDNALRYSPAQASVTVRTLRRANRIWLEVEDTGPGIAVADRERVFDRFFRVLGTGADGSGLGLSIVREISLQHQAGVRIDRNPNADLASRPGTLVSVDFAPAGTGANAHAR